MDRIEEFLRKRVEDNLLRSLNPAAFRKEGKISFKNREYIDLSSNDYLGLSNHPALKDAAKAAIDRLGVSASASRLLSGDLDIHHQLEEEAATLKGKESALVFNSGYQANLGIISSLCQRGDAIFSDRLNHASIIDGMLLSGAKLFRFAHNNIEQLEFLLKEQRHKFKDSLIVTESIFSMDGDRSPLKEIVQLKTEYNCALMVDEAHATGIFGENGAGLVEEEGLSHSIEYIMGTFSKALGSFGGYLACSEKVRDYLINSSRSFIYSTALPPPVIASNIAGIGLLKKEPFRRRELLENAGYFRQRLSERGFKVEGSSQIIPLITGESQKAIKISQELKKRGYWALPIRPPTVPPGESRLRFSLTYHHSKKILEELVDLISGAMKD